MIRIVHVDVSYDDDNKVTGLDIKFKSKPDEAVNKKQQHLVARISSAVFSLEFAALYAKNVELHINQRRIGIIDMTIKTWENEKLNSQTIGKFIDDLGEALTVFPF